MTRIGVITTSYPRFEGDSAGNFVGAHVAALRALGHDVEVIAAGPVIPTEVPPLSRGRYNGRYNAAVITTVITESKRDGVRQTGDRGPTTSSSSPSTTSSRIASRAVDDVRERCRSSEVGVTRIESSLFYRGGAPDALEAAPLGSLVDAARFSTELAIEIARRADRWDSIIAHWLVPCALAALPANKPLLAIAHGGDVHTLRRLRLLRPVLHALRLRGARLAFVSDELRAIAMRDAPELARWLAGAIVQPMGIDLARFAAIPRAPTTPPTILVAGRLVPIKGVDIAIAAMQHLRTPARLVIAGDGPARGELERDVSTSERAARESRSQINFLGEVSTSERDRLLGEASVVVVPSRVLRNGRTEGTPLIALEALAAGVPVVASAVGGLASLAGAHRVRPDDPRALAAAIDRVLAEPLDARSLRSSVGHLEWASVARVLSIQ